MERASHQDWELRGEEKAWRGARAWPKLDRPSEVGTGVLVLYLQHRHGQGSAFPAHRPARLRTKTMLCRLRLEGTYLRYLLFSPCLGNPNTNHHHQHQRLTKQHRQHWPHPKECCVQLRPVSCPACLADGSRWQATAGHGPRIVRLPVSTPNLLSGSHLSCRCRAYGVHTRGAFY